jgi:hypothetical protein
MSVPPEVVEVVRRWLEKTEHDFLHTAGIMAVDKSGPAEARLALGA